MSCSNCGEECLTSSNPSEKLVSVYDTLPYDDSISILEGIKDLCNLQDIMCLVKLIGKDNEVEPKICELCLFHLSLSHLQRGRFFRRQKEHCLIGQLVLSESKRCVEEDGDGKMSSTEDEVEMETETQSEALDESQDENEDDGQNDDGKNHKGKNNYISIIKDCSVVIKRISSDNNDKGDEMKIRLPEPPARPSRKCKVLKYEIESVKEDIPDSDEDEGEQSGSNQDIVAWHSKDGKSPFRTPERKTVKLEKSPCRETVNPNNVNTDERENNSPEDVEDADNDDVQFVIEKPPFPYYCRFCKIHYDFRAGILAHMRTHHKDLPTFGPLERGFRCCFCNRRISSPSKLLLHMFGHTGEDPHLCKHANCSFFCASTKQMDMHVKRHRSPMTVLNPVSQNPETKGQNQNLPASSPNTGGNVLPSLIPLTNL